MKCYYTPFKMLSMGIKEPKRVRFKSEKKVLTPKEKELITKFRRGQIWKNL